MIDITVNDERHQLDVDPDMPLLWVLRDVLKLKGTKYGCGVGVCGICTVLIDGQENHSCMVPLRKAGGHHVITIEGLAVRNDPLLGAWVDEQVPQCGYCQPGQILAVAALLKRHPRPSDLEIDAAMSRVLCRCGTYGRIRRAVHRAAGGQASAETLGDQSVDVERPDSEGIGFDDWIQISPDGAVTITINHSEMGQGALTGLAMLVAEELDVNLSQVRTRFAPADRRYRNPMFDEQTTGGSTSIRGEWDRLRRAGARTRERLIRAAAETWEVDRKECGAQEGFVVHAHSGRRLGYGELAHLAAGYRAPQRVALKKAGGFRLLGKSTPRLEIPAMVVGRAVYGSDIEVPGMLFASLVRCPVFGGRAEEFDAQAARDVAGVHDVVEIEQGVAVVAENTWAALRGREQLRVHWNFGLNTDLDTGGLRARLVEAVTRKGKIVRQSGNVDRALKQAACTVEAVYETSYLAHATLEPMNCVARVSGDRCDVWVGTQSQEGAHNIAVEVSGLPRDKVHIHTTLLGGGFGRRLESDVVAEAVQLAKKIERPVQVLWTRADDLQHDFYRPAHHTILRAALGKDGAPSAWWQRSAGPSLALDMVEMRYAVPNYREERVRVDSPVPVGAWRSVGAGQNAFVVEGFIDELAHKAGKDPLEFRLALLKHEPRARAVLELAAEKAGWSAPRPADRFLGIAWYYSFGSYAAQVAQVTLQGDAGVRVERVVCAIDCGIAVNPDAVRAQIEGGIAMGLSAALKEEVRIEAGRVTQETFEDYPILTFSEMPSVEVYILPSSYDPGGVGEPGVPPIAAAVANAVYAATGQRLRRLPLNL